ncbi:MAG TPA: SdrD B-like domain-containing protein, partial [Woeseiaceae bacterium]|nr:SdrD B-like domain-containing protein [Woeseiaceae bacterium]
NFSLPADGDPCLVLREAPAGAALHIGASRVLPAAAVNLRTLAPCASPAGSGSIGDIAWSDADRDGIQDAGEAGLAGAAVSLVDCTDGRQLASAATGADGRYVFAGLPPGRYRLRFTAPDGFAFSPRRAADGGRDSDPAPSTGLTPCFDQAAGQHRGGVDAGLHASAGNEAVAVTAWNRPNGGVSVTGNVLRYSGSPTGWLRNTISSARLSEVASGDAFEVRWLVRDDPASATWTTGLGNQAAFTDWRDIEHGLRNSGGFLKVYENGTWQTSGPALAVGDVIAVRVLPGAIEYRHDGQVVHTSVYPERREFYVNASFLSGPNALEVSVQPLP